MFDLSKGKIRLFTVFGTTIGIHWTFFFVGAFLFVWDGALLGKLCYLLLFFWSVLIHEIAHALAGALVGNRPTSIMLAFWGGMTDFKRPVMTNLKGTFVAFAGPLSNLLIVLCGVIAAHVVCGNGDVYAWLKYFTYDFFDLEMTKVSLPVGVNIWHAGETFVGIPVECWESVKSIKGVVWINGVLAVFNLVPAYPLDGGRIFRNLTGAVMGQKHAAITTMVVGRSLAVVFACWCIYHDLFRERDVIDAVIGCFIAYAVWQACYGEYVRTTLFIKADEGDPESEYIVAHCYLEGLAVEQDSVKAFEWFARSAEHGYAAGQYHLAIYYEFGVLVEQSIPKAAELLEKSMSQDYLPAAIDLRLLMEFGLWTPEDGSLRERCDTMIKDGGPEALAEVEERRELFRDLGPSAAPGGTTDSETEVME